MSLFKFLFSDNNPNNKINLEQPNNVNTMPTPNSQEKTPSNTQEHLINIQDISSNIIILCNKSYKLYSDKK
jgi:hypothetical protein